jgi:EAL domain-containing protein (putative c-di-GMP-specific phosphodiesterase class I)
MHLIRNVELPNPLATVLQPIVEIHGDTHSVHAVECLTRGPRGSAIEQAPPLFDFVREHGLEFPMDRKCVTCALRTAAACTDARVAINVHPATLADERDFVRFLIHHSIDCGIDLSRLIVEIGEQTPAHDARQFQRNVCRLRDYGVHIAVDDVGFGHSNYKAILDCRPEYLKIDRYFVQQVSADRGRQAVIRSICDLADFFGALVVAEGVETTEDDEALREMGIRFFQGFLYGRPASATGAIDAPSNPPIPLRWYRRLPVKRSAVRSVAAAK